MALLPAIVLVGLVGWQMAVAGYAWTVAGGAARAGARAGEVGAPAREAALAAIPGRLGEGAEVVMLDGLAPGGDPRVRVRLVMPRVLPLVPLPGHLTAEAPAGIDAVSP